MRPPLPQQNLMKDFMVQNQASLLLADPGLGKTRASIDAISELIGGCQSRGALVVAPLRVARMTWPAEVTEWSGMRAVSLRTAEGQKAWKEGSADIYVTNTEYLQQTVDQFLNTKKQLPVDTLVIDELSKFKNPSSKRGRALLRHRPKFERVIGLTGSVSPKSYIDVYAQVRLLDGGKRFGPSFNAFRQRFFQPIDWNEYTWELKEGAAQQIEALMADMSLVLRAKDWLDIPPVHVEDIDVALSSELMREYRKLEKELLIQLETGDEVVALSAASLVNKLRQFTSGCVYVQNEEGRTPAEVHDNKIQALRKHHDGIKRAPVLVGCSFIHEVERILKEFPYAKEFNENDLGAWNDGKIPMWVANAGSISHGLNLQYGSNHILWFSLPYDFDLYNQFNCRLARNGQTRETFIHRLMVPDSIDWAVAENLRGKEASQNVLLSNLKRLAQTR